MSRPAPKSANAAANCATGGPQNRDRRNHPPPSGMHFTNPSGSRACHARIRSGLPVSLRIRDRFYDLRARSQCSASWKDSQNRQPADSHLGANDTGVGKTTLGEWARRTHCHRPRDGQDAGQPRSARSDRHRQAARRLCRRRAIGPPGLRTRRAQHCRARDRRTHRTACVTIDLTPALRGRMGPPGMSSCGTQRPGRRPISFLSDCI